MDQDIIEKSKEIKIAEKKAEKKNSLVQKCTKMILNSEIGQALEILKEQVRDIYRDSETQCFQGAGNVEDWKFYYPKGPLEWFEKAYLTQQSAGNVFDLLNICFMLLLSQRKVQTADVLQQYNELQEVCQGRFELTVGKAHTYYQNEQFVKAKQLYLEVKESQDEFFQVELYLAWIFVWLNNSTVMEQHIDRYLEKDPQNLHAKMIKILASFHKLKRESLFLGLVQAQPKFYRAYYQLAICYSKQFSQKKLKYLLKAFEHEPTSVELASLIGQTYLDLQNLEEAQQQVRLIFQLEKDSPHGYFLLGLIQCYFQNYGKAIQELKKAVDISPYSIRFNDQLAIAYHKMAMFDEQRQVLLKLSEMHPYSVTYETNLGYISVFEFDDLDEGEKYCKKALTKRVQDETYWNYAAILMKKGQFTHALRYLYGALCLFQFCQEGESRLEKKKFCYRLAYCHAKLNLLEQAREWAVKYLEVEDPCESQKLYCLEIMKNSFLQEKNFFQYFRWELAYDQVEPRQSLPENMLDVIDEVGVQEMKQIVRKLRDVQPISNGNGNKNSRLFEQIVKIVENKKSDLDRNQVFEEISVIYRQNSPEKLEENEKMKNEKASKENKEQ